MWLHAGRVGESIRPFHCERDCDNSVGRRQLRGCNRFDLPEVEWEPDPEEFGWYLGRFHLKIERPTEEISEGCPGGYQRAPMLYPLHRYYRRRDDHGNRVANPFFDKCEDWLVQSAVLYLESEEERCHAEWIRCDNEVKRMEMKPHG